MAETDNEKMWKILYRQHLTDLGMLEAWRDDKIEFASFKRSNPDGDRIMDEARKAGEHSQIVAISWQELADKYPNFAEELRNQGRKEAISKNVSICRGCMKEIQKSPAIKSSEAKFNSLLIEQAEQRGRDEARSKFVFIGNLATEEKALRKAGWAKADPNKKYLEDKMTKKEIHAHLLSMFQQYSNLAKSAEIQIEQAKKQGAKEIVNNLKYRFLRAGITAQAFKESDFRKGQWSVLEWLEREARKVKK